MFGTSLLDRRSKPERIADQAWEQLVSAVHATGDTVRHTARDTARSARRGTAHLADGAGDRAGVIAGEAWERAGKAYDALAGRRPGLPWGWLVGAGLAGVAIGWAVGMASARAQQQAETTEFARGTAPVADDSQTVEFVDVDRPVR